MITPLDPAQLDAYLHRVGLSSPPPVDPTGLAVLQRAQFFSIPFENLDILLGLGVDLDPETVFAKLVGRLRGGYCFELNGLMLRVLHTLGFDARPLLARVHLTDRPSGRTHQVNLVELAGKSWIVDVGFGASGPRAPFALEEGVTECGDVSFELSRTEPWGWMLLTLEAGEWKNSYSFDLGIATPEDIEVGNHFTSTSPRSHFTSMATVSLPTPGGRVSLRDLELIEIDDSATRKNTVDPDSYLRILSNTFGIDLPEIPPLLL